MRLHSAGWDRTLDRTTQPLGNNTACESSPPLREKLDRTCSTALRESIQAHFEQMFQQDAKLNVLNYAVGRTRTPMGHPPDDFVQAMVQQRECEAQMNFHAGRALELGLHLVYAKGTDRLMGRETPAVEAKVIKKDRGSHSLVKLYNRIVNEVGRGVRRELEHVYQQALHKGVFDFEVDGKVVRRGAVPRNNPFYERVELTQVDGAERSVDHSTESFGFYEPSKSGFCLGPPEDFRGLLTRVDAMYYEPDVSGPRRGIRWEHYAARDHEPGRPYIVVGILFFARLVQAVVRLSYNQRLWNDDFALRWHERRSYNVDTRLKVDLNQRYEENDLSKLRSPEDMVQRLRRLSGPAKVPASYDSLHETLKVVTKPPP